jgi:Methyltransferase domain
MSSEEIQEGFLNCVKCGSRYPVISSVPFMLKDFSLYLSIRMTLGGQLMLMAKSQKMKSFVKNALGKINNASKDTSDLERNWSGIYKRSMGSKFYTYVKDSLQKLPKCDLVLEHGCSIGSIVRESAKRNSRVFGIDKSFYGILEAKKRQRKNSDFVVADSLNTPFGNQKFDLVIALNLLDIVEPSELLQIVSHQTKRFLVLSDPYDFERGKNSVKSKTSPKELRLYLKNTGFKLIQRTIHPSFIPWKLNVNSRLSLNYKVDLIVAQK